ncbi:LuxR family transcriptional regulator [Qingshengfaniella alkalisoli]|uniref:LuxR family transcriptional regulator n=1 Tax=Qingshengfaniella alkalisoli TaxID=2599296 RepID=A0A5B8IWU0_9RHOB|nr:LuxR family transcriptional regulator [Qingshengfaniella alkalisoli]QDY69018.1 LuxR family transcriptional regulator [Qingshengfaniella alkalisoli]
MLSFIEYVNEARSIEEVWVRHIDEMTKYGFDRLLYGFTRFRTAHSFGDPLDCLVLTNHDKAYTDRFINDRLYNHGPMTKWAAANTGACSWRWISEHSDALTPSERKVVDFNRQMGVTNGYSISFKSALARHKGAIGLTARKDLSQDDVDAIWEEHGRMILAMNNIMHLKIMDLPYSSSSRALTPRQREALEWVGDGKTMQDIAIIMGLKPATIEKHLRLAREVLDVETTAQAVMKASVQNQIFVLEA